MVELLYFPQRHDTQAARLAVYRRQQEFFTVGRVAIIGDVASRAVASNGLVVIRCQETVTPQYLAALLRTEPYQHLLVESSVGTSIRHLSVGTLRQLQIPLPPLGIQQRLSARLRPGQSVESVLSVLSARPAVTQFLDSILEDSLLKQWAALSSGEIERGTGLTHLLSRILSKSRSWSTMLGRESRDDPTTGSLLAWLEALQEFSETQELQKESDRWAAMHAWFTHFTDERSDLANAFKRLREIRNRSAHGIEPAGDPGVLWKYSLLERLRDSLRLVWEHESKALTATTQVVATVSPSILTVGIESELTFTARNEGALPLRRVELTTAPFESSTACSSLSPKEEHRWTLKIRPRETGKIDITVKWTVVRLDRTPVSGQVDLAIEVQSLREQSFAHRFETNPYVPGLSIDAADAGLFFGREEIFQEVKRCLRPSGPGTVLILEGVRRVGKTSFLKQLLRPGFLPQWIGVYYDFQGGSNIEKVHGLSTGTIFYEIAKETVLACHAAGLEFDLPHVCRVDRSVSKSELMEKIRGTLGPEFEQAKAPFELFQVLIDAVIPHLGDRRMLLLLDEFDKVQSGIENGITSRQVPDNFRNLFHSYKRVSAILTGSQLMKRLRREYFNPLFGIGRAIPIGPLDPSAAREVIVKPSQGALVYSDAARDWIVEACACQPFLIQHVCSRVFDICADTKEMNVSTETAKKAAEVWLKSDKHFDTVWRDDIHDPRRQYVALVIHELQSGPDPVTFDLIYQQLEKRGLYGSTALTGYLEDLRDLEVIRQRQQDRLHAYSIAIPLLADWLRVNIDPAQFLTKAVDVDGGKL
jgi:type I restriction enzyme M protein